VPGLDLPDNFKFGEVDGITAQVQRGRALKQWYRVGRFAGQEMPSLDLATYPLPDNAGDRRSLSQLLSIGSAYFEKVRVGDLVVVPPLRFEDPVLVGELLDAPPVAVDVGDVYPNQRLYGRRVRWLTTISKNDVPSRIIEISQKPNSFVQLERSTATWFYDRAYRSYFLEDRYQAELKVLAESFGATEDIRLSAFLNFVAENFRALESKAKKSVSIHECVFADLGAYEPQKRVSINSPGEIVVHALRITPLLFVVMLLARPRKLLPHWPIKRLR